MAAKREGAQFIVHLKDVTLSAEAEAEIAREVRAAAMRKIAQIDLRGDLVFRIPRKDWLGIWIERIRPIELPMPGPLGR